MLSTVLFMVFIYISQVQASERYALGLYKSTDNADNSNNPVRNYLSAPLSELGYKIDYRDVLGELPDDEQMKKYDCVVTFYFNPVHPNPEKYIKWLKNQVNNGKKVIIFGNFGAHTPDGNTWLTSEQLNDFFFKLGLAFRKTEKTTPDKLIFDVGDKKVITSIPSDIPEFLPIISSIDDANTVYLEASVKGRPDLKSYLVVGSPEGGIAQIGFIYSVNPETGNLIWNLDRKEFLNRVLSQHREMTKAKTKRILGLYKASEKQSDSDNFIRRFAAEPLYKLGYSLDYHNIEQAFPADEKMNDYDGIITWYNSAEMINAPQYCAWLAEQISGGRKVIILSNFGAFSQVISQDGITVTRFLEPYEINNFFYPFGLRMDGLWTNQSNLINIDYIDDQVVNRNEINETTAINNYFRYKSINQENRAFLTLNRTDVPDSLSDVVVRTPYGGMALQGFIYSQNPENWDISFKINLEKFFAQCMETTEFVDPESFQIRVDIDSVKEASAQTGLLVSDTVAEGFMPRKVLVLYKGSEETDFELTPFYSNTGPVLNHLGVFAEYYDIETGKPDDKQMEQYMGVVAWFTSPTMIGADDYNRWLLHQIKNGKRIILMQEYGALYDFNTKKPSISAQEVFDEIGLAVSDEYLNINNWIDIQSNMMLTSRPYLTNNIRAFDINNGRSDMNNAFYVSGRIVDQAQGFFGFEKRFIIGNDDYFPMIKNRREDNRVLLSVFSSDSGLITPVVSGNWGAISMGSFFFMDVAGNKKTDPDTFNQLINSKYLPEGQIEENKGFWVMDPFRFFEIGLGLEDMPKPDYTTLNGKRIFYSHVDGDGLVNTSEIYPAKLCGEIIREEIFEKYNLPVSASVITEEIMTEKAQKYYNRPLQIAREIFVLDNIEVANHTHNHPYNYVKGDVEIEIGKGKYKIKQTLPSPETEVKLPKAIIDENAAPQGKENKIILWSGMCNPAEVFIAMADRINLRNLNGGDPLFDDRHKSISNICPVLKKVGERIQVHTSGSNDYIYTAYWTGNFDGMKNLLQTFRYSEAPRRLLPMNIYYHFYSAMYDDSLNALKTCYDYCLTQDIAPLFASQYSAIVVDFANTVISRVGDGYRIQNQGHLRTVRFDNTGKVPDLNQSKNILGFNHHNRSLYVFLDENRDHEVYLTDRAPDKTYLVSASHYIGDWNAGKDKVTAVLEGIGPGSMQIANMIPNTLYKVSLGDMSKESKSDSLGNLEFKYEFKGKPGKYSLEVIKL